MTARSFDARSALRHPFWQAVLLLVVAYVLFRFGVQLLPPLMGMKSAPVPSTVVLQYMAVALVGVLIYVSDSEARWRLFKEPLQRALVDQDKKWIRIAGLVLLPALVGWLTFQRVRPSVEAGAQLRSIHPAPPMSVSFPVPPISVSLPAPPVSVSVPLVSAAPLTCRLFVAPSAEPSTARFCPAATVALGSRIAVRIWSLVRRVPMPVKLGPVVPPWPRTWWQPRQALALSSSMGSVLVEAGPAACCPPPPACAAERTSSAVTSTVPPKLWR